MNCRAIKTKSLLLHSILLITVFVALYMAISNVPYALYVLLGCCIVGAWDAMKHLTEEGNKETEK